MLINESGLYALILSSKLAQAKEFKCWVTSEVLLSIRRNGAYLTDDALAVVR
jgi:prophage antirepressor-like protein